jgi:quercetin dioxygenase-like cupin family protein
MEISRARTERAPPCRIVTAPATTSPASPCLSPGIDRSCSLMAHLPLWDRPRYHPTVSAAPRAVPTVQIDNERLRVTQWRFAPGATTGFHRHEYAYVVVPLTTGRLASTGPAGDGVAELVTGVSYFRPAGVEHDVRNANAFEFVFVEIELKTA